MPDRLARRGTDAVNGRRVAGAVAGSLIAGVALSAVMLAGEALAGKPSELIELERATADKLGIATPLGQTRASVVEQLVTHGGHLALSALAGLSYAAAVDDHADDAVSGAAFGAAFFVAAYGFAGPLLGVTPVPWRQPPLRAVQHPVVHILFGMATALTVRKAADLA